MTFARALVRANDGTPDRKPLNSAMSRLANFIWEVSGFRYRHVRTTTRGGEFAFHYHCSDSLTLMQKERQYKRDILPRQRFDCGGRLRMRPYLAGGSLTLSLGHSYHKPYTNISLHESVQHFIDERATESTPSHIYRDLMASELPNVLSVRQQQVYYRWQQLNSSYWRRDKDPIESASILLSEPCTRSGGSACEHIILVSGHLRGLAIFVKASVSCLHSQAKELVMDATFGTNNSGMDLFAVLAEVEGIGIPLAYCFVGKAPSVDGSNQSNPGALTFLLEEFLRHLQQAGFSPTFFGVDKDLAEIAAVRSVWPDTTLQLCLWHAMRAIRAKLKDASPSRAQAQYFPEVALDIVPGLEICWGSLPTRRPNGDHRYGRCNCPSNSDVISEKGRIEVLSADHKNSNIRMYSRHFNSHSLIPDRNGTFRSFGEIHRECASEMYLWCKARNFYRLWAYLFVNWYCAGQFKLWARSANHSEIPVLKTTMILESHWRKLKHDYLHRFNRPRIDLVTWILLTRVIPDTITRMQAIWSVDQRNFRAAWRKPFKRQWKAIRERYVEPESIQRYHTDPRKWVCACDAFLDSRFLICKHLIHCVAPFACPASFFATVRRGRKYPLWDHEQLLVLPEYAKDGSPTNAEAQDPASVNSVEQDEMEVSSNSSEDSVVPNNDQTDQVDDPMEGSSDEDDQDPDQDLESFLSDMQSAMDIAREQQALGNKEFVDRFISSNASIRTLVCEVNQKRNRRTQSRTWAPYSHIASWYYNSAAPLF